MSGKPCNSWRGGPVALSAIAVLVVVLVSAAVPSPVFAADEDPVKSSSSPSLAAAQEPPLVSAWSEHQRYSAPEAVQAAASDEHHFYAISSTQVAKYDRGSGERQALSRGAALHLNSGIIWEGNMYCAHSNYPQLPEQSQIKLLNLQTMELSIYRDFGNYGGSLTWCVFHAEHWWCHFAKYGSDNRHSFLVKFDRDWREVVRYSLPEQLVEQLGNYSLSGGVWWHERLLVTGHDDPVLFQLRVPEAGTVLILERQVPVPFTGQGLAIDPRTGNLVGIDRPQRQVIFAKPHSKREVSSE